MSGRRHGSVRAKTVIRQNTPNAQFLLLGCPSYGDLSIPLNQGSVLARRGREAQRPRRKFGRGDDTVGDPHRAQISQFELFELLLSSKLDNEFSIERFEPTVSQSTVSSPALRSGGAAPAKISGPAARRVPRE